MKVIAGEPPGRRADAGLSDGHETPGTSHLSVVDAAGNGVSFTTTVNGPFGSHLMAGGFVLNSQLTDFNLRPSADGKPAPNSVAPGKRPRSSMAPLIIFEGNRKMRLLIGSPGGSKIIDLELCGLGDAGSSRLERAYSKSGRSRACRQYRQPHRA